MNHCPCGKRINKHASSCRVCHHERSLVIALEFMAAEKKGVCPAGHSLNENRSLSGSLWLQCVLYPRTGCFQILCSIDARNEVIANSVKSEVSRIQ